MFVIELTYTAPLRQIDAAMKEHVAYLTRYYESGHFVVSGRQVPRTGGVILAVADSREQLEAIVREEQNAARPPVPLQGTHSDYPPVFARG